MELGDRQTEMCVEMLYSGVSDLPDVSGYPPGACTHAARLSEEVQWPFVDFNPKLARRPPNLMVHINTWQQPHRDNYSTDCRDIDREKNMLLRQATDPPFPSPPASFVSVILQLQSLIVLPKWGQSGGYTHQLHTF